MFRIATPKRAEHWPCLPCPSRPASARSACVGPHYLRGALAHPASRPLASLHAVPVFVGLKFKSMALAWPSWVGTRQAARPLATTVRAPSFGAGAPPGIIAVAPATRVGTRNTSHATFCGPRFAAAGSNPTLNRRPNGMSPWPRGACGSSCASRPRRHAVGPRLAPR